MTSIAEMLTLLDVVCSGTAVAQSTHLIAGCRIDLAIAMKMKVATESE